MPAKHSSNIRRGRGFKTDEFDKEFVIDSFGPPPSRAAARWERARKRGRPRIGEGSKTISISVEKSLLARTDRLAKRLKISRARIVAKALETTLAAEGL